MKLVKIVSRKKYPPDDGEHLIYEGVLVPKSEVATTVKDLKDCIVIREKDGGYKIFKKKLFKVIPIKEVPSWVGWAFFEMLTRDSKNEV
jgi:hypothetical protein